MPTRPNAASAPGRTDTEPLTSDWIMRKPLLICATMGAERPDSEASF
jgi:hypothetical protein